MARPLPFDPEAATQFLRTADRKFVRVIDKVPTTFACTQTRSTFESLAESIIYQQLTGKAAATILGRFRALYPGRRFPSAADVLTTSEKTLRTAGLSGGKVLALQDLARKVEDGTVPGVARLHRLGDDEIVERLTAVRGVGRWTAEMLLIFRLGRPDVLPSGDYGVRKGFALLYRTPELPAPKALEAAGERWRPYRTMASWYLWRACEVLGLARAARDGRG